MNKGKTIEELQLGESAFSRKTITEADVLAFADVSDDHNPVHLDEEFAKTTMFKGRIVHGMLVGSLFSSILGTKLPGNGSIYLAQELKFVKPVRLGDTITATVTIIEIIPERNRIKLETTARNQNDELVITGIATIMPPKA